MWKWDETSEFKSWGKETTKIPKNLNETGKYSQDSIHEYDKNTAAHSAWNVVILSEILDIR